MVPKYLEKYHDLTIHIQETRLSQFEHFEYLVDLEVPWVMFTDDDDLWSPDRVRCYAETLFMYKYRLHEPSDMTCLVAPLCFVANTNAATFKEGIECPTGKKEQRDVNYVHICCRGRHLDRFCKLAG